MSEFIEYERFCPLPRLEPQLLNYNTVYGMSAAYAEVGDFDAAMEWSQKAIEMGSDEQQEALQKELESYKVGKPFRELLTAPEPEEAETSDTEEAQDAEESQGDEP